MVAAYAGIAPEDVPFSDAMGVPITFLDKYCPDQFEIIGGSANGLTPSWMKIGDFRSWNNPIARDKKIYQRMFIRRKQQEAAKQPTQQNIVSTN